MDIVRIGKTMLPAVVVLVAGLFGINFVYNTYLKDGAASVITLEPAAGEEGTTVTVEDGATTVTETVSETVTETVDECATADAAAAAAVGTETEAEAAKAASDCAAAKAVKADADVKVEEATDAAVDAAVEGVTEHLPVTEGDDVVAPAETEAAPAAEKAAE